MQIGAVAEATGLSLRTIRYYEEVGLITPSARSAGGFRLYTEADVERLRVVMGMKPLDFSLEEMRDLLDAFDTVAVDPGGEHVHDQTHAQARERLAQYEAMADERCARLRRRLANAEEFTRTLRAGLTQRPTA
nr:MerR family transcriptional regulator [Ruania alba]